MPFRSLLCASLLACACLGASAGLAGCGTARAGSSDATPRAGTSPEIVTRAAAEAPDEPPGPLAFSPETPFFVPGERMRWDVTWMGVTGGLAGLAVGSPGQLDGRNVLVVRSESRSDGLMAAIKRVRDQSSTHLDLDSAQPISFEGDVEFGERKSRIVSHFAPPLVSFQYQRHGQRKIRWSQRLPAGSTIHNLHSALGALRAWRPERGDTGAFYGISGRRVYRVELEARGREIIDTPLGRLPTLRIHGTAQRLRRNLSDDPRRKPRLFDIWLTDDVNRLPVRVSGKTEYGDVEVALVQYNR